MAIWQYLAKIALTSLLSILVLAGVVFLARASTAGRQVRRMVLDRHVPVILILILLILLLPVGFLLAKGESIAIDVLGAYAKELLLSAVIVVSFGLTWRVLSNLPRPIHGLQDHKATAYLKELIEIYQRNSELEAYSALRQHVDARGIERFASDLLRLRRYLDQDQLEILARICHGAGLIFQLETPPLLVMDTRQLGSKPHGLPLYRLLARAGPAASLWVFRVWLHSLLSRREERTPPALLDYLLNPFLSEYAQVRLQSVEAEDDLWRMLLGSDPLLPPRRR